MTTFQRYEQLNGVDEASDEEPVVEVTKGNCGADDQHLDTTVTDPSSSSLGQPSFSSSSDASSSNASTLTCDQPHSRSSLENCKDNINPTLNFSVMTKESLNNNQDGSTGNKGRPQHQNTLNLKVQLVKGCVDEVDKSLPNGKRPDPEGQTGSSASNSSSSASTPIETTTAAAGGVVVAGDSSVASGAAGKDRQQEDTCFSVINNPPDMTKSHAFLKLEAELINAKKELQLKEEECDKLSKIRDEVESELQELTASLFQEAHRMVGEANEKRVSTEKSLAEATMKIEGLETEVTALKALVLTSTPSQPNRHLHPQIDKHRRQGSEGGSNSKVNGGSNGSTPASKKLSFSLNNSPRSKNKSPNCSNVSLNNVVVGAGGINGGSHSNTGGDDSNLSVCSSAPGGGDSEAHGNLCDLGSECDNSCGFFEEKNIDPVFRQEFLDWKKSPASLDRKSSAFLDRIYKEDIELCLDFPAKSARLKELVTQAIHNQTIYITPLKADKNEFVKDCPLLNSDRVLCKYLVRLGGGEEASTTEQSESEQNEKQSEDEKEFRISQLARNRITAVCNLLNYLDYIKKGLVKSHTNGVYWEIVQLRKRILLARLGFSPTE